MFCQQTSHNKKGPNAEARGPHTTKNETSGSTTGSRTPTETPRITVPPVEQRLVALRAEPYLALDHGGSHIVDGLRDNTRCLELAGSDVVPSPRDLAVSDTGFHPSARAKPARTRHSPKMSTMTRQGTTRVVRRHVSVSQDSACRLQRGQLGGRDPIRTVVRSNRFDLRQRSRTDFQLLSVHTHTKNLRVKSVKSRDNPVKW